MKDFALRGGEIASMCDCSGMPQCTYDGVGVMGRKVCLKVTPFNNGVDVMEGRGDVCLKETNFNNNHLQFIKDGIKTSKIHKTWTGIICSTALQT